MQHEYKGFFVFQIILQIYRRTNIKKSEIEKVKQFLLISTLTSIPSKYWIIYGANFKSLLFHFSGFFVIDYYNEKHLRIVYNLMYFNN